MLDNLIKERYCIKEETSWADICKRVADFIAVNKKENETFYNMMLSKDFIPNSPTLMNAGTVSPMLSACFKSGTMIETITIPTPIEDIMIGDVVLSHDGSYNRVTNTMINNDFIYKVKIDKLPPIYVTGDHPFFTNNGWKCVKDLIPKKDFVKIGQPLIKQKNHVITFKGKEINGFIYVPITNKDSIRDKKRDYNIQTSPIKNNIIVDEDICWFIGMYLSQRSLSHGYDIRFVLNLNDKEYATRLASILKNKFGLECTIKETLHPTTWLTVRCHSKFLANWFNDNFGHGFDKKYIPQWIYKLNKSCITALIQGVDDGDGCYSNEKSRQITLCNEPLVRQLFMLIKMIGYSPSMFIAKMPKLGTTLPCCINYGIHNAGMVKDSDYYRVSYIEPTLERHIVYNFEVENTHTYIANQIVVHNCFYLPISDCISNGRDGIFDQVRNSALVFKFGGGVGLNFSNLRPHGSKVKSTNGVSSGAISFMKNFNTMTETIKQGGKRRGALMGCLDITHPEIADFITCKTTEGDLSNFNISVKLTDDFMKDIENSNTESKILFNSIVDGIYKNGEPGILFKDTIEKFNPTPELGELNANPCITGDTLILTKRYGNSPISNFVDKEIEIWNGFEWSTVTPKITGYNQKILKITITNYKGEEKIVKCTPYHTFILREEYSFGKEIRKPASELKIGECIYPFHNGVPKDEYHITRDMIGDNLISKIDDCGMSDIVYCLNEPKNHSFIANGVLIGNCAEALLLNFESCNLGSINLSNMYKEAGEYNPWIDYIDWVKYESLIRNSVKFLDHVIDKNQYPLPEIDVASKLTRKVGLGIMGFHDLLLKLKIPYDTDKARDIAKELESFLKKIALNESIKNKFDNKSLTTIAPTGTISLIAEVSSGIEPVFNWVITRKDTLGEHYMLHPLFEAELDSLNWNDLYTSMTDKERLAIKIEDIKQHIITHCHKTGTIQDLAWLPQPFKTLFKNAMDINWEDHIKMQATFQNNGVDMSISKTINLPNNATKDDIKKAIFMAWELGCKGLTIYRSGSREHEVLNLKQADKIVELKEKLEKNIDDYKERLAYKRPRDLFGETFKVQSGCGKLFVTINEHNGKPYEVFIQSGGDGGCEAGNQALGRTISLALRNGGDIRSIIKQLCKVKCPAALRNQRSEGKSCSDIVGKLIKEYMPDEDIEEIPKSISHETCPDCNKKTLIREAGCKVCHSCGYSKCG